MSSISTDQFRVLAVDDNASNRLVISEFLRILQIDHFIASSGTEALELLKQETYHTVLLDIEMPILDGPATAKAIREFDGEKSCIPIAALTAHIHDEEKSKFMNGDMDRCLSKPIVLAQLKETLDELKIMAQDRLLIPSDPDSETLVSSG